MDSDGDDNVFEEILHQHYEHANPEEDRRGNDYVASYDMREKLEYEIMKNVDPAYVSDHSFKLNDPFNFHVPAPTEYKTAHPIIRYMKQEFTMGNFPMSLKTFTRRMTNAYAIPLLLRPKDPNLAQQDKTDRFVFIFLIEPDIYVKIHLVAINTKICCPPLPCLNRDGTEPLTRDRTAPTLDDKHILADDIFTMITEKPMDLALIPDTTIDMDSYYVGGDVRTDIDSPSVKAGDYKDEHALPEKPPTSRLSNAYF